MKRLLLAVSLVWQFSGFAGVAAAVCTAADMPEQCCCHQSTPAEDAADVTIHGGQPAYGTNSVSTTCPCALAPGSPESQRPAEGAARLSPSDLRVPLPAPVTFGSPKSQGAQHLALGEFGALDSRPSFLTAAPTRC